MPPRRARNKGPALETLQAYNKAAGIPGHYRCNDCGTTFLAKSLTQATTRHWPGRASGKRCKFFHEVPASLEYTNGPRPPEVEVANRDSEDEDVPLANLAAGSASRIEPGQLYNTAATYTGVHVARVFNSRIHYGEVMGSLSEIVVERGMLTTQYQVVYEDGDVEDYTRQEIEQGIALFRLNPPRRELQFRVGGARQELGSDSSSAGSDREPGEQDTSNGNNSEQESDEHSGDENGTYTDCMSSDSESDEAAYRQLVHESCSENVGTHLITKMTLKQRGLIGNDTFSNMLKHEALSYPGGNLPHSYKQALKLLKV